MRYGVLLVSALLAAGACTDSEQSTEPRAPAAAPAEAAVTANATWQPRADYPTDLYLATSASYTNPSTLKTTLYVIGGATKPGGPAGSLTDAVRAYNVSTNTWSSKAKLPIKLEEANQALGRLSSATCTSKAGNGDPSTTN